MEKEWPQVTSGVVNRLCLPPSGCKHESWC